jgi:hypothetical protein
MNAAYEITLGALRRGGNPPFEGWEDLLREAFEASPPPHGMAWYGRMYRALARAPEWFANSLVLNAEKEGYGSRQVWKFGTRIADAEVAGMVYQHAMDESRHSRMFSGLLDALFPGTIGARLRAELEAMSPGYSKKSHPPMDRPPPELALAQTVVIDELIQVNYVEIRALVLQLLLRPVLVAYAPPEEQARFVRASDALIRDETRHIAYSAHCIEQEIRRGGKSWVREIMLARQVELNRVFMEEVASERFEADFTPELPARDALL